MLAPEQNTRSRAAGDDDRARLRVLEADALERVGELDVDAEVVGIELERVAGADAAVLGDVRASASRLPPSTASFQWR